MLNRIVIVGGGAGGLELACRLGRKLGPQQVTLIDANPFHVWKPSLHEVAAGTLDIHQEGLSYSMLAHDNGFTFVFGAMTALDRGARQVVVSETRAADGMVILPQRSIDYDLLVLAVGSESNYFGVAGAAEHTLSLNGPADAEWFRLRMLKLLTLANTDKAQDPQAGVQVVIIGGGATGVELAAELREASEVHGRYGYPRLDPRQDVRITLLEGAPRILAPLPERVSHKATQLLAERRVTVRTQCQVTRIEADRVTDADGQVYPADLIVWAAGIKAPAWLTTLGLPQGKNGQLRVDRRLRVEGCQDIMALGDCAACEYADGKWVPPRAQSAHQQADYLARVLLARQQGRAEPADSYVYRDYGSLVSMGTQTSVGSLMGNLFGATWFVEGLLARCMYVSLHLLHHRAVLGAPRTALLALARFLVKRTRPLVKLH
ncbi:MAG: NAD(P)/FAD-dependent oxidoreductase [Paludibacterium sp.]|uniref:NAD(P)/FAD-dependent oxidoreductase n=1 Tax=Paludibacterium sp. TaxID=1917523 RepID=UPI0025CF730A|nr:NAD(P)/FAD-dependent oxidoreductase [Paludibacterium sp.]MBV8047166.1 NAD(P)/FAD-dependent oxidoreductase [Paludibacterium sp.]MBV8649759.1 NAD(P)/FAD-dependent oxidoreductase [Paludibacterium sp.]